MRLNTTRMTVSGWVVALVAFLTLGSVAGGNPVDRSASEIFAASEALAGSPAVGQSNTGLAPRSLAAGEDVPFPMYPCGEKKEFSSWKDLWNLYDHFTRQLPNGQVFNDYEPGLRGVILDGTTWAFEKQAVDLASAMSAIPPEERTQEKFEQALATFPTWVKPKPGHFTVEYVYQPKNKVVAAKIIPGQGGNFECVYRNFWIGDHSYIYYDWPVKDSGQYASGSDRWDYQNRPLSVMSEYELSRWFMPAVVHFYIYMGRTPSSMEELLDFYELEKNLDYPGIWNTLKFESWATGARISYRLPSSGREVVSEVELADKSKKFVPNWP